MSFNKLAVITGTVQDAVSILLQSSDEGYFTALFSFQTGVWVCTSGRLPVEAVILTWIPPTSITTSGRTALYHVYARRHNGKELNGFMSKSRNVKSVGRHIPILSILSALPMVWTQEQENHIAELRQYRFCVRWSMPDWGHSRI